MAQIYVSQIKKKARQEKAAVICEDEASFRQDSTLHSTWARKGCQPLIPVTGQRKSVKVFATIDLFTTKLVYQKNSKFNADTYLEFLEKFSRKYHEKKVHFIQDNASYHKDERVKKWFDKKKKWITVYHLPPYSPDYNPAEKIWKYARSAGTHNQYFKNEAEINHCVDKVLMEIQRNPCVFENYLKSFI